MRIDDFDTLPTADAVAQASVWAAIPGWVDALVAGRPYGSVDALVTRAGGLAQEWTDTDLDTALARHPRIGERANGEEAEAAASRREQAAMSAASVDTAAALAAVNRAYEERFGRVFLIRAAGRSPEEILAEARRRLTGSDQAETEEALNQLREIALLRLREAVTDH